VSRTFISASLRREVRERALSRCEYCLIHEDDALIHFEIDHIIAEKHTGPTELSNLALSCYICNNNKGSDIASLSRSRLVTRLFHPRTDTWSDHFQLMGDRIEPRTPIGEATERLLEFNIAERRDERRGLQLLERYPYSQGR
jgi:hypothetical protein